MTSADKSVLMVSYLFPPIGGGGVQRTAKFVKYLDRLGWRSRVITARTPENSVPTDYSLWEEIPESTQVSRVRGLDLPNSWPWRLRHAITSWLLVVDQEIGWYPFAVRTARHAMRREHCRVIYSTSPPYTNHLVARRLHATSNLPWIADFRDPWLENFGLVFASPLHRSCVAALERGTVSAADRVVVAHDSLRDDFLTRYAELPADKFVTLPNGYDAEDFGSEIADNETGPFTLLYAGGLYGSRSVEPLLKAIKSLLDTEAISGSDFRFRLCGMTGKRTPALVRSLGLERVVEVAGYRSHRETIRFMRAADALVLLQSATPEAGKVCPAKAYEYLAASKPILAIIPQGTAAELLRQAGEPRIVDPKNHEAIVVTLRTLYEEWQADELRTDLDSTFVGAYERSHQAAQLARIFEAAAAVSRRAD